MISILTTTYNRAHTLGRLFESLQLQSDKNFEWVVVDDGSTDGTADLLDEFSLRSVMDVVLVQQANAGKHIALNRGVEAARGDWVFIVDSDDMLVPSAIAKVYDAAARTQSKRPSGLCFRRADFEGNLIGARVERPEYSYMHPTQAASLFLGDLAYVFKTSAMRANPFPFFAGEKFVPELMVWNRIADQGTVVFFNHEAIYICEYLTDGYTANFKSCLRQNPVGFGMFYSQQFARERSVRRKLLCGARRLQCLFYSLLASFKC